MSGTTGQSRHVLVVDDDAATRKAMGTGLRQDGFRVTLAASAEEALSLALADTFDAVVADVVMGGMSGIGLLRKLRDLRPDVPVVVITGYGSVDAAVEAMREGAADYLPKPVRFDHLVRVLDRVVRARKEPGDNAGDRPPLVGHSESVRRLLTRVAAVAPTDATVLIRGESGTGKELVAREIHAASTRRDRGLVVVNCAAITESLAESELFGHEKGAFTGALRQHPGKIEQADGGTLFLDEVGDLSPASQTKLLRVLQDHVVERVGSTRPFRVDVRVVAATNRDLERLIRDGRFREDLYYRLRVFAIDLPPLRDRLDDVPVLVRHFLDAFASRYGRREPPVLGRGVLDALRRHPWPGNVRELRNVLEEAVILGAGERIALKDLPPYIAAEPTDSGGKDAPLLDGTHGLDEIERAAIQRTLIRTGGNRAETARILGIGLKTLYRKLTQP